MNVGDVCSIKIEGIVYGARVVGLEDDKLLGRTYSLEIPEGDAPVVLPRITEFLAEVATQGPEFRKAFADLVNQSTAAVHSLLEQLEAVHARVKSQQKAGDPIVDQPGALP